MIGRFRDTVGFKTNLKQRKAVLPRFHVQYLGQLLKVAISRLKTQNQV